MQVLLCECRCQIQRHVFAGGSVSKHLRAVGVRCTSDTCTRAPLHASARARVPPQPSVTRAMVGGHSITGPSSCFLARIHHSSKFYLPSPGVLPATQHALSAGFFLACPIPCSPSPLGALASLQLIGPLLPAVCMAPLYTRCRTLAATTRGGESRRCPWSSSLLPEIEGAGSTDDQGHQAG